MIHHWNKFGQIKYAYKSHSVINVAYIMALIHCLQVLEKNFSDIRDTLIVNHCFLSIFISVGTMNFKDVDKIMKVTDEEAISWQTDKAGIYIILHFRCTPFSCIEQMLMR